MAEVLTAGATEGASAAGPPTSVSAPFHQQRTAPHVMLAMEAAISQITMFLAACENDFAKGEGRSGRVGWWRSGSGGGGLGGGGGVGGIADVAGPLQRSESGAAPRGQRQPPAARQ